MLKRTPRVRPSATEAAPAPSLRAVFDAQESPLLRYAFSLTGRRAVAEEIVQEVFLQLHIHWDEVDAPRDWLFRSVRNRAFNHVRDHRRETLCGDDRNEPDTHSESEMPDAMLLRMEADGALREILEQLDDTDRQLVHLKYFEGLKYREISATTGLSVGNVGYRLHHILKQLADKLRSQGIDQQS
ncbi:RNA polymerase sigma factor [Roseimaritima ulvae]|uniref:ECF RNA polymerase sigma factor SigL n=1 Tax=Roseimaritima ulvae TaxID=980254 RepID=A0A5B9QGA8_9BACT|nr:sigma-70 family RNA polymerase sigma factor [Roseimaritima ulvae]QEG38097.1 ECF RNA polymerase sigma factor SigL [Roseimaritima ulvae]